MSDHEEPNFDDPAFDDVRDLLADARVTDPVPDEVAARLDATLASLQAERVAEPTAAVVPLRHRAGRIMVAAAAVVVIGAGGVGIAQLDLSGSDSDAGTAATADREDAGGTDTSAPEAAEAPATSPSKRGTLDKDGVARMSHATFAQDAARLMVTLDVRLQRAADDGTATLDKELSDGEVFGYVAEAPPVTASPTDGTSALSNNRDCAGPDADDAITLPATLDGAAAVLVFRPPTADAQQVEAWTCDGNTLLATASVPRS